MFLPESLLYFYPSAQKKWTNLQFFKSFTVFLEHLSSDHH